MTLLDRRDFAIALAREAGALAQSMRAAQGGLDVQSKGPQDFVTAADLAVETLIRDRITARFPDDAIIGEEGGRHGNPSASAVWIIDPIDGTTNFMRGLSDWAVSIGCSGAGLDSGAAGPEIDLGVIFAPDLGLLFDGILGTTPTARQNGVTLQPHPAGRACDALVAVGWSPRTAFKDHMGLLEQLIARGADYRRSGAATIGLISLASGRVDAYVEQQLNLWDAAAGIAIIKAAGGVVIAPDFTANLTCPAPFLAVTDGHHPLLPLLRDSLP